MTRFARARGSKASNERTPEDGTPWEVMKEQLLQAKKESTESKKREEAEKQRIENYENFLNDRKVQKRTATWCDFPEIENNNKKSKKKNEKKKKNRSELSTTNTDEPTVNDTNSEASLYKPKKNNKEVSNNITESNAAPFKSKKKNKKITNASDPSTINTDEPTNNDVHSNVTKPKMKQPQRTTEPQNDTNSIDVTESVQNNKKRKKKRNIKSDDTATEVPKPNDVNDSSECNQKSNSTPKPNKQPKAKKNKKLVDGKPVRRKEINDRSFQLIVNGKEIELVRFDGFPVMKKDAERLQELKTNMIKKGIPKSEVQRTMKLERRRAEKALARAKRDVCYNCRKGGHVLSDCPELKSKIPGADGADGVCFKCGSTEHRQFECKVQRDKEFRFATCFICKEPGHIARQCPDNPKGLYPNGGNCKLCGDVTHLRKDCPTVMDQKQESTVKLHTLDTSEGIEEVGQQNVNLTRTETSKKPKKIKF